MNGNGEDRANDEGLSPAARAAGFASPFDRPSWFDLLEAHGFAGEERLDARGTAGGMTAWLPLRREGGKRFFALANWYSFAVRPLFDGAGDEQGALRALFGSLRAAGARLDLYPVADAEQRGLAAALREAGWWVKASPAGVRHWLDLEGLDHDSWWKTRPGALRSTVRRKSAKGLVDIEILTDFDARAWAEYETVYAASWKPAEGDPGLLRAFARAEGARGTLRLGIARIKGEAVAAQFWTVEEKSAFIHKLAHVEDSHNASPGTLLSAALFRRVIDIDQVTRVDFGTGDDAYKADWMNRREPLWRLEAFNRARCTAWGPAAKAFAIALLRKDH